MDKETRVSLKHDIKNGISKENIIKKYKMNKRAQRYYFTEINKGKILKTNTLIHKTYPDGMDFENVDVASINQAKLFLEATPYATDCSGGVTTTISPLPSYKKGQR